MRLPSIFNKKQEEEEEVTLDDFEQEEIVEYVLSKPSIRSIIIEKIRDEVDDVLKATLVNAIKAANERPPIWWQWLLLFVFGAMAGVGIGIALAPYVLHTGGTVVVAGHPPAG